MLNGLSAVAAPPETSGTREALEALLLCLENDHHSAPSSNGEEGQVLIDIQLEDARYILMRHPVRNHRESPELSPREQEIARMVAAGYPNKIIAGVLDISTWTVCTYMRRIFAKLNVTSRAAMVAKLHRDGSLK